MRRLGSSIRKSYSVDQAVYYLQRCCEQILQITEYRTTRGYSHVSQKWSSQVLIFSTCKCVYNFRIRLCLSCIHISQVYIPLLSSRYSPVLRIVSETWMSTSLWYNFRTSELVGLYVAWVYTPPALKSTQPQVQAHRSWCSVWLVHGYTLDNPVPNKIGETLCKIIMLDSVTLSWKIVEIDDGLFRDTLVKSTLPETNSSTKGK